MCGDITNSKVDDILPLKAYLVKLVETETRKKNMLHSFIPFTRTKILINAWPEDTNTNINIEYHVQSYK